MFGNDNVPEFPPSNLICTPAEWRDAFEAGKQAKKDGMGCIPPRGKTSEPWTRGWKFDDR